MGVVFLARDRRHRTVALKVLRSSVAGDPTARRRLAREVETMQRVRSPNVAEVIDADLDGNTPYIVTRFVPGRTLDDVVTQDGPLRAAALSRLACGLADALVAVHAAGVVHRDVKPGNVMLFQDTPVVIDFGIAQGPDATRLTMTGMFMGTPGYLAPEVIEGRPSSEASDVHAWGATVAFAAIGRPPYGTGPYEGIFYRIVNGQADLTAAPGPLLPLLAAALARDPAHRPSAVQLHAQAAVLDPATLVMNHGLTGQAAPGSVTAGTATRSDATAGAAPGGPAAYVPPAPVASGPAGYVPPTVVAPGAGGPTVLPAPGSAGSAGLARHGRRATGRVPRAVGQAPARSPRDGRYRTTWRTCSPRSATPRRGVVPQAGGRRGRAGPGRSGPAGDRAGAGQTLARAAAHGGRGGRAHGQHQRRPAGGGHRGRAAADRGAAHGRPGTAPDHRAPRRARGPRHGPGRHRGHPALAPCCAPCSRCWSSRRSRWPPPRSRPASRSRSRRGAGRTVPSPTPRARWCCSTGSGRVPACHEPSSGGSSARSPRAPRCGSWWCSGWPRSPSGRSPRRCPRPRSTGRPSSPRTSSTSG